MNAPRCLIVDSYYPDYIRTLPPLRAGYTAELRKTMEFSFSTSDSYSRNLAKHGWETEDVIANHVELQRLWWDARGIAGTPNMLDVLKAQIAEFEPDVIFFQDLSLVPAHVLFNMRQKYILAGQCSCPLPGSENIRQFHVLFSSLKNHLPKFEALGVKAVYNPLGFDPVVLERFNQRITPGPKIHDCVFIGGVGAPSHWKYGMEVLETVARDVDEARFWGYGYDLLPKDSYIRPKYMGEAWALRQYEILSRSRIALNRHGEVAENYCQNQRLFETTGSGALLVTELKTNLGEFFDADECVAYTDPEDAAYKIRYYLRHPYEAAAIAKRGQERTLRDHTYEKRMKTVSDTLRSML